MFNLSLNWWEFVLRALIIYFFLLIVLRLTGRRQVGQLSPFDFVTLLVLSNAVQNSMNGGDNSITAGLVLAATLVSVNWLMGYFSFKIPWFGKVIDGTPEVLIHHGKLIDRVMRKELITKDELEGILRRNGLEKISDVQVAIVEPNGSITVVKKNP